MGTEDLVETEEIEFYVSIFDIYRVVWCIGDRIYADYGSCIMDIPCDLLKIVDFAQNV